MDEGVMDLSKSRIWMFLKIPNGGHATLVGGGGPVEVGGVSADQEQARKRRSSGIKGADRVVVRPKKKISHEI